MSARHSELVLVVDDDLMIAQLVEKYLQGRSFGVFGEPHVNVLALNMALDNGEAG